MVQINYTKNSLLNDFSIETLKGSYLLDGEDPQECFARVAKAFADDEDHAQRLYNYMSDLWFMPASPILTSAGTGRGLPISCFLNEVSDSLEGIIDTLNENVWLASLGGGIGTAWGKVREAGARVGKVGTTCGIIPFIKMQESQSLAISQGSLRRGSTAVYLPIWHPEIEEFIDLRKPTGGAPERRTIHLHNAVVIDDIFMEAVANGTTYALRSTKDNAIVSEINARNLWAKLLTTRMETGEPYLLFIDNVQTATPIHHSKLELFATTSNLCNEIVLPTGEDYAGNYRTAVCCLSSLNLEYYDAWKDAPGFIKDTLLFLDNVLQYFIDNAPDTMSKAKYAASRERSIGLGVMGFHSYLQKKNIPWECAVAKAVNNNIFQHIAEQVNKTNIEAGRARGNCPDWDVANVEGPIEYKRWSYATAIAPTANISIIAGGTSPSIEPKVANAFIHKTKRGSFLIKNKFLEELLESKGINTRETWDSITAHDGSVQHLDELTDDEKEVYKTAYEINQLWLIDFAANRTPYIDQSTSLNIFVPPDISKKELHDIHFRAWQGGVKGLYYCRSKAMPKADITNVKVALNERKTYDDGECLACQ